MYKTAQIKAHVEALTLSLSAIQAEHNLEALNDIIEGLKKVYISEKREGLAGLFGKESMEELEVGDSVTFEELWLNHTANEPSTKLTAPPIQYYRNMGYILEKDGIKKTLTFKGIDEEKREKAKEQQKIQGEKYRASLKAKKETATA